MRPSQLPFFSPQKKVLILLRVSLLVRPMVASMALSLVLHLPHLRDRPRVLHHLIAVGLRFRYCSRHLPICRVLISFPQSSPDKDVDLDPSWNELFRRLRRITPYLWPKKSRPLQLIAVCPDTLSTAFSFYNFFSSSSAFSYSSSADS
jgi:hypothetical protein